MRCPHCDNLIRLQVNIDVEEAVDYVFRMLVAEGIVPTIADVEACVDYTLQYLADASYLDKDEEVAETDSI